VNNATYTADGPRHSALLAILRTADILWDRSRLLFERWDLSPAQFNLLNVLSGHPDGISQTDLGRELLTHRSNVTGMVDRLEERRLVARNSAEGDRRAWRVALTEAGRALIAEVRPAYHAASEEATAGLSDRRAAELKADLERMAAAALRYGAKGGAR
jgi:DNA-binding MarR family transcriptional regulator